MHYFLFYHGVFLFGYVYSYTVYLFVSTKKPLPHIICGEGAIFLIDSYNIDLRDYLSLLQ